MDHSSAAKGERTLGLLRFIREVADEAGDPLRAALEEIVAEYDRHGFDPECRGGGLRPAWTT